MLINVYFLYLHSDNHTERKLPKHLVNNNPKKPSKCKKSIFINTSILTICYKPFVRICDILKYLYILSNK